MATRLSLPLPKLCSTRFGTTHNPNIISLPYPTANPTRGRSSVIIADIPISPFPSSSFSCSAISNLTLPIFSLSENIASGVGNIDNNIVEEVKDPNNILQKWEKSFQILKEIFTPAPNSPAAGGDLTEFFISSALLLLVFWLGNYVVPDMIFKNTVFRKREGDDSQESSAGALKNLNSQIKVLEADTNVVVSNDDRDRKVTVGFGSKTKSKKKRRNKV